MRTKHYLEISLLSGEIMISSGSEIQRVEDTMERIVKSGGFDNVNFFITLNGIIVTINEHNQTPITMVKTINSKSSNMSKISAINDFSREFVVNELPFDVAMEKLNQINNMPGYNVLVISVFSGLLCFSAEMLLFPNFLYALISFIIGFIVKYILTYLQKYTLNDVIVDIIGGFLVVIFAVILTIFDNNARQDISLIIISSLMPLFPGLTFTNSIRDIIDAHYLSGMSRFMYAIIIAIAVAIGVTVGYNIYLLLGGVLL